MSFVGIINDDSAPWENIFNVLLRRFSHCRPCILPTILSLPLRCSDDIFVESPSSS